MIQRYLYSLMAALLSAFIIVTALPSGSTQARWSDSTTLTQPQLTTVSTAEPALPPEVIIDSDLPADVDHSTPGFSVTPGTAVTVDSLTLRRGKVVVGSGMPNLPNHVVIDMWLVPENGANTCQALSEALADGTTPTGAIRLGGPIKQSDLNGSNKVYRFPEITSILEAGQKSYFCPVVTLTKDTFSDYQGASFELIIDYAFSATGAAPTTGQVTTLFAVNGDAAQEAPESSRPAPASQPVDAEADRTEPPQLPATPEESHTPTESDDLDHEPSADDSAVEIDGGS